MCLLVQREQEWRGAGEGGVMDEKKMKPDN